MSLIVRRALLAASLLFSLLGVAQLVDAAPDDAGRPELVQSPESTSFVVDVHKKRHGLGLLKKKTVGAHHGVTYWTPKIRLGAPKSLDLRAMGLVGPVKDQGQCGSCWAHAIVEALEAAIKRVSMPFVELGPQELVSCDKEAYGCGGGTMDDMAYVVKYGVSSEASYPYRAADMSCKSPLPARAAQGTKWGYCGSPGKTPTIDEVKQCLQDFGVLAVVVAAGGTDWSNGGHMNGCRTRGQNHMVTLAGWLETDELIVRNSWGVDWGDKGDAYAKLGCDELGSGAESVAWVQVDAPGPGPSVPKVTLPAEIDIHPGTEVPLGRHTPETGVTYAWFEGDAKLPDTDSMIYVSPTKDTVYRVQATNSAGVAESSVSIKVLASDFE